MRTVDLFAGCGGFSLGFQQAGFDLVAAFDNWQPAIDIYRDNFNHPIFEQDLGDVEGYRSIVNFAPELIIGGPPCQDFSSAGKRNENLGRANLTKAFANIVCLVKLEYYYRHPRSYQRRWIFSIHEPSPTVRGVNRPIPKTYQKHSGDACDLNEKLRPLTTIERSYLQTFPKTFKFKGNKSDLEQAIGNAVPVNLAKYVADCIKESIDRSVGFDIPQEQLAKREMNRQLQLF
jgi:site-specific DNA-cytosine methylase